MRTNLLKPDSKSYRTPLEPNALYLESMGGLGLHPNEELPCNYAQNWSGRDFVSSARCGKCSEDT